MDSIRYTYYGRLDNVKPKRSLAVMMIEEHVEQILMKSKEWFAEQLKEMVAQTRKETKAANVCFRKQIKVLNDKVKRLSEKSTSERIKKLKEKAA